MTKDAPDELARRVTEATEHLAKSIPELTLELQVFRKALGAVLEHAAKMQGNGLLGSILGKVLGTR